MIVTGGQRNDGAMLTGMLAQIHVPGSAVAGHALVRMLCSPTAPIRPA